LGEIEIIDQVAEDRHVLTNGRPRVRTPIRLGIDALPVEEHIFDELQVCVETQGLVINKPLLCIRADHQPRDTQAVAVLVDRRRDNMILTTPRRSSGGL